MNIPFGGIMEEQRHHTYILSSQKWYQYFQHTIYTPWNEDIPSPTKIKYTMPGKKMYLGNS